ncbi:hypothetical protein HELRODRAFT_185589 [Helobdella robusta]|uniref:Proteasome inhibitor PI31 subunit n=1 Tax=Helobdella robusta TaxID=6412 RepID=T1FN04_HELRO|nr:hypothetical protein HELRODRAFT_185589 [Helobdella robusta]ESO04429.1 hypothetical protein HELRODRAFT_185589 [Helobdella robusta]
MSLEILYHAIKSEINSHFTATVATVHYLLIQHGFKCVALGEKPPEKVDTRLTDLLPPSWNENTYKCSLVYWSPSLEFYLFLKIFHMKEFALVHLLKNENVSMKDMDVQYSVYFSDDFSSFQSLFQRPNALLDVIDTQLIRPSLVPLKKEVAVQNLVKQEEEVISTPQTTSRPSNSATAVSLPCGRCDLDPLCPCTSGGASGMLFDPLRNFMHPPPPPPFLRPCPDNDNDPSRIPLGSVPPGARFDPIGPNQQDPRRTWEPDPDHLKMPSFNDRSNL